MKKPEKIRAILLDRDGVVNEEPGPILEPSTFRFIHGSIEAIARINKAGWLCLLVTNQAALARGQMNHADLSAVTQKMNHVLLQGGAHIDAMYFCSHHPEWDCGRKLAQPRPCGCRKPEPGLLHTACGAHGIQPSETVMIGDTTKDFEASRRFGCFSIGVHTGHGGKDGNCKTEPNCWKDDLSSAVDWLIDTERDLA